MRPLRFGLLILGATLLAAPLAAQQLEAPPPAPGILRAASEKAAAPNSSSSSASSSASESSPTDIPDAPAPRAEAGGAAQGGNPGDNQESHKRVLGLAPQFSVAENSTPYRPLTVHEKWRLFYRQAVDPFHFLSTGVSAGIGQARDQFHDYGQGMQGYGKRYGAGFADSTLGGFFGGFLLPSMFHDDPRYFRLGSGSILHRGLYAATRVLVTRHDDGSRRPNYPGILGIFIGTGFGNLYYPRNERGPGTTFVRGAYVIEGTAVGFAFQEFWPDIHNKIFKKKKRMEK